MSMTRITLVALLVVGGTAAVGPSPRTFARFPGTPRECAAPGGAFEALWVPADEVPSRGTHLLLLRDARSNRYKVLREFGRRVDVSWSPTGRWLAVADAVGSDGTASWVYPVAVDGAPLSVWALLEQQHGKAKLAFTAGAHHLYVEANDWTGPSTLSVRIWGYGDNSFDKRMRLRLSE
jgi:hypothetical protein